jgi:hypothetical protein
MKCLFLIVLICQSVNSCKNFLVQHCTDIPIGFNSITTIKCIQLIPAQFDLSIDYSVENYITKKTGTCYDIISYRSPSTNLFSNQCQELCPEQYCLLFDNQPNTSIINVFYSQSSTYDLNNLLINNFSSYDYYLFDSCSSTNEQSRILLIVVYVLCSIVGALTIGVVLKYIISGILRRGENPYNPYSWRWIIDCLLCQIRPKHTQTNEPERHSDTPQHDIQRRYHGTSTQSHMISNGSSNNTHEQGNHSNNNSTYPGYPDFSSESSTPIVSHRNLGEYYDGDNDNLPDETVDYPRESSFFHNILQKLSSKASNTLSMKSTSNNYETLEARPSPDLIITRF